MIVNFSRALELQFSLYFAARLVSHKQLNLCFLKNIWRMGFGVVVMMLAVLFASCALTDCGIQRVCIAPHDASQKPALCESTTTLDNFCSSDIPGDVAVTFLNDLKVIVNCSGDSGLRCLNVSLLTISGIEFIDCIGNLPFLLLEQTKSTFLFMGGSDITLTDVKVSVPPANYGFYIKNVAGKVVIESCIFISGNAIVYDHDATKDIGVEISNSSIIGDLSSCLSGLEVRLNSSMLTLDITDTTFDSFEGNVALYFYDSGSVTIANTEFIGGRSHYGGGLFAEFYNKSEKSTFHLNVISSKFITILPS